VEYEGPTEINQEIATRGKYTKIAQQAIDDFQSRNTKIAKIDITCTDEKELKALYNALKSLIRRKKIPIKAATQKDKVTNQHEIYLLHESP
jgi:hypothetical protein